MIRCATETKFQPLQVQQPALEILLAFTFNNEAYQEMKENILQLKSCLSSSHQSILSIVQYILWRLEEPISENVLIDRKYDLIFSFCQSDSDLPFRISEQLIEENFGIYLDQSENIGRLSIHEKCQLIDSCEYFLIFISDSYKQNLFCRCEVTYAFEHQCQIIPLILTSNYRPDGWLNRIISGKISIDFTKLNFELGINKLKNEINRQKKNLIKIDIPKKK